MGFKRRNNRLVRLATGTEAVLRFLATSDAESLYGLVDRERTRLREWLPWVDATRDSGVTEAYIVDGIHQAQRGTAYRFGIEVAGEIVGIVSLEHMQPMHQSAHVGYWLAEEAIGRGLMSASVRSLLSYAFDDLGLHVVELRAAVENRASRAVAERVGFRYEGVLRERELVGDRFFDHAVYSMLAREWRRRSSRGAGMAAGAT